MQASVYFLYISNKQTNNHTITQTIKQQQQQQQKNKCDANSKRKRATWLILPVVIRLSQRLSHACLSLNILP